MKFLIDAQLPLALADRLRKWGHVAEHVRDVALHDADDAAIRDYANRAGMVLVTKERDFVPVDDREQSVVQVIWARTGNISNRVMIQRIEAAWPRLVAHLAAGARLVELR